MRARLRTLSKENAENVGLHLVMTGRLLDSDPELAYEHAQAAVRRAGRVDVVREAAGLADAIAVLTPMAESSNAALVALMIARGALDRQESRGAHWRRDFPHLAVPEHTETTRADLPISRREPMAAEEAMAR